MDSDGEIARRARMLPVNAIGEKLGIPADALIPYGHVKAKISAPFLRALNDRPEGDSDTDRGWLAEGARE